MTCNTLGGAVLEIGQRIESISPNLTYADFASMTFTEIKGLVTLGSVTMTNNTSSYVPIASIIERTFKTTQVGGLMENTFVPIALDPGQAAVALAAADQKYNYAIRLRFANGDALIFAALVLNKSWQGGQAVTPNLITVPLQVNSNIIEVIQPEVTITSGSGYAGSIYTSTVTGQWMADGVAIAGATGLTWTMTAAREGQAISLVTEFGATSNVIEMAMPSDYGVEDFDSRVGITLASGRVAGWTCRSGAVSFTQTTASLQPAYVGDSIVLTAGNRAYLTTVAPEPSWLLHTQKRASLPGLRFLEADNSLMSTGGDYVFTEGNTSTEFIEKFSIQGGNTRSKVNGQFVPGSSTYNSETLMVGLVGIYDAANIPLWAVLYTPTGRGILGAPTEANLYMVGTTKRILFPTDYNLAIARMEELEGIMAHTYGLTLPETHPYRYRAPRIQ